MIRLCALAPYAVNGDPALPKDQRAEGCKPVSIVYG
jgi:hypothetical protein